MAAASEALLAAVAKLDMIDLCGRIVSNPERNAPRASVAEIYALAKATEGLWAVALEANFLVNALEMLMPWDQQADADTQELIATQMAVVRDLLAFMHPIPTKQENTDGSSN
ncbi:hypothetical protein EH240_19850 [Mesorhizobium tamadayense]|uniref:Uncharacterized protein n=1 Tax=Mesorhizobium tamadayense TaxID=425306 RepID=A0A3P3FHF3_9HYPH|nr:hypothetical protein [Mesorhizobium tamadayense]RRH98053.1 hypothetical protein EH240_19850 [Mesorhizobium tamadayense]